MLSVMSKCNLGVNVLMLLSRLAATILNDYDFQITETHHKNKKDIPLAQH